MTTLLEGFRIVNDTRTYSSGIPDSDDEPDLRLWTEGIFDSPTSRPTDRSSTNDPAPALALLSSGVLPSATQSYEAYDATTFGEEHSIDAGTSAISQRRDEFLRQTVLLLLQSPPLLQGYLDVINSTGTQLGSKAIQREAAALGRGMFINALHSKLSCTHGCRLVFGDLMYNLPLNHVSNNLSNYFFSDTYTNIASFRRCYHLTPSSRTHVRF